MLHRKAKATRQRRILIASRERIAKAVRTEVVTAVATTVHDSVARDSDAKEDVKEDAKEDASPGNIKSRSNAGIKRDSHIADNGAHLPVDDTMPHGRVASSNGRCGHRRLE
jgi:sugar-specific transcriptional regulator TrmB